MLNNQKDTFHRISISSSLFKGQEVLYFCYLKSEKIAHAIAFLCEGHRSNWSVDTIAHVLVTQSASLPNDVAELAADVLNTKRVLSRIYSLLSTVRLCSSHSFLEEKNAELIVCEYEMLAEKISSVSACLHSLDAQFFSVPPLDVPAPVSISTSHFATAQISDFTAVSSKGQIQSRTVGDILAVPSSERRTEVLKIVSERGRVSIKDISKNIRNCSEKTIQRELNALVRQGSVRKEGERRWSVYLKV